MAVENTSLKLTLDQAVLARRLAEAEVFRLQKQFIAIGRGEIPESLKEEYAVAESLFYKL